MHLRTLKLTLQNNWIILLRGAVCLGITTGNSVSLQETNLFRDKLLRVLIVDERNPKFAQI